MFGIGFTNGGRLSDFTESSVLAFVGLLLASVCRLISFDCSADLVTTLLTFFED